MSFDKRIVSYLNQRSIEGGYSNLTPKQKRRVLKKYHAQASKARSN